MKKINKKGFTIVELVIVIAVIAILAAVLIPTFSGITKKANNSAITQETRAAVTVLLAEKNGQIPANTYVIYQNGTDTSTAKWFKYENGKLETANPVEYATGDEVYSKTTTADIIKNGNDAVSATSLSDLSANVEILIDKTN